MPVAKGNLKGCTEALICSAQEQALRTNYVKFHIDKTGESPLSRMCKVENETLVWMNADCEWMQDVGPKGIQKEPWQCMQIYSLETIKTWLSRSTTVVQAWARWSNWQQRVQDSVRF